MSLNVRGICDEMKRKATFLFCKRSEADLILLQETHSCESDVKFWTGQRGNEIHWSYGTNHSAGVSIFLRRFKVDILEVISSNDGGWIAITLDHSVFIVCNIYGHNSHSCNKALFCEVISKLNALFIQIFKLFCNFMW